MDFKKNKPAETFKMGSNWPAQSKHLKEKYPTLTDADLKYETGKEEELLSRIGKRLDEPREEVISIINKGR